jgi:hypothetical protein
MGRPKGTRPPNAGKGRKRGVPNKATADARAAIALFVNRNAHRLQGWLDAIADGVEGPVEKDEEGNETKTYVIEPDPQKAFELFQSIIEYHVPKLARSEYVDGDGKPLPVVQVTFVKK